MTARHMAGILEAGFLACLLAAAIAIGGTVPLAWAAVEFAILLLAAAALWVLPDAVASLPWKGLGLILAFLLIQFFVLRAQGLRAGAPEADFLIYLAAFALAAALSSSPAARSRLVAALLALGVGEAFYGLAQELAGWQQILGIEKIYYRAQATGTYVNPNHYSGLLEMLLPLALAAAAWHWDCAERQEREGSRAAAAFFAMLALLMAAGVFASRSRMGMLSATAGAALASGLWTFSVKKGRRRMRAAALAGALAAAALFALWLGTGPIIERFRAAAADSRSRLTLWRESAALVRARPLAGAGWGSYPILYPQVQASELEFTVEHAHNDYLELAVEFGIPGALLLAGLAAYVALRALGFAHRNLRERAAYQALSAAGGITALGIHSIADFNLRLPANALIFSALLGLAWAAATRSAKSVARD